jgi:subtilisin family serine protease
MSNYGAWVDVSAPGVNIFTTVPAFAPVGGDPDGDGYCMLDGTSLAAPIIAGVAGMLLAKNPAMTADQVRTMIQSGVDMLPIPEHLGTGKTNVYKTMFLGVQGFNPPVALLASTMDSASATGGPVTVIGTANGTNATYKLLVGAGVNPIAWTVFQPTTPAQVVNGALGTWSPTVLGLTNGTYTLRLEVTRWQKKFIDDTLVTY